MALQNRVTPTGDLIATDARGTLMGNRGIIHDPATKTLLTRRWQHQAWVCCRLEFKGYRHPIMGRGSYTELFFLEEATALAAGHRPCGYCRRADFNAFKAAWLCGSSLADEGFVSIKRIDRQLHRERIDGRRRQVRFSARLETLPDGVMIEHMTHTYLGWGAQLFPWHAQGYLTPIAKPSVAVTVAVLTPRSMVAALAAGYRPVVHRSVIKKGSD